MARSFVPGCCGQERSECRGQTGESKTEQTLSNAGVSDIGQGPRHVAIIMGGNDRWAATRSVGELEGHQAGLRAVRSTITAASTRAVPFLTLFTFAAASWSRPRAEIAAALELLTEFVRSERERLIQRKIRVNVIGSLDDFPTPARRALESLVESTAAGDRMTLTLALSYGARRDIAEAARWIAARVRAGLVLPEEIDEDYFGSHLATRDLPPLDLLIRTGGEARLSDFLLFEAANAEVLFLLRPWPEFDARAFDRALERYARRRRRVERLRARSLPIESARVPAFDAHETAPRERAVQWGT
jgi:undecaprenyl diphosphate synthase